MTLKIQFDSEQPFQKTAVESVARLFEGLPRQNAEFTLGDEIVPNLPPFESLNESWLYDNLRQIQQDGEIATDLAGMLEVDDGMVVEGVGNESWRHPSFTIEMETGTGKTYVALRTIYELRKRYGFSKFIVVVPSIAIYEGWIKNFKITRDHFRALYENETVNLIEYDGARISQLRAFATSTFVEILVITLDSFNKTSNVIFKPSEKLPGERLPFQYIQQTAENRINGGPRQSGGLCSAVDQVRYRKPPRRQHLRFFIGQLPLLALQDNGRMRIKLLPVPKKHMRIVAIIHQVHNFVTPQSLVTHHFGKVAAHFMRRRVHALAPPRIPHRDLDLARNIRNTQQLDEVFGDDKRALLDNHNGFWHRPVSDALRASFDECGRVHLDLVGRVALELGPKIPESMQRHDAVIALRLRTRSVRGARRRRLPGLHIFSL